ncbi:sensor histidine kinase [Paenibacillus thalictri]|uniref:Sensor histidine kinase n=1 Tax=Paenibacillus thalictri TaxID=2527873 RepID=A0A4Q9DLB4_9BACL|nr:sensor histidine kinase [Paenibacillus thalictri]TBL73228.1 sensor histidine kinase [Paenibacillus thalictri]
MRGAWFRITSIQTKIFLGLLTVAVLSTYLVMIYMYGNTTESIKRNAIQYASDGLSHSAEKLAYLNRDIERVLTVVTLDQDNVASALVTANTFPTLEWFQEIKKVEAFLQPLRGFNTYIDRLAVIGLDNRKLFQSGINPTMELREDEWSERLLRTDPNRGRLYVEYRNGLVAAGKLIFAQGKKIGYAVLDINQEVFESTFYSQPSENMELLAVSSDGTIIHHRDKEMIGRKIQDTVYSAYWTSPSKSNEIEQRKVQVAGKTYIQLTKYIPVPDWEIIALVSESDLLRDTMIVRDEMIRILLIVYVLVLVVSMLLSKQITRNLKALTQAMELVKRGDMNARPEVRSFDEVGRLSAAFTTMMQRIRDLMNDVEERERQKREADFKALQSQIHPHFIYNTLNTIRYLANIQHTPNIEELTASFITLLRGITSQHSEKITVREELALLTHYLTIQKYRYIGILQYTISSDPACEDCEILKFTLQPIVENALLHGIGPKPNGGTIHVEIFQDQEDMVCIVHDDGVGMTEEQVQRALQHGGGSGLQGMRSGVGIRNVQERIKLYYGERYGMTIYSDPGSSTTVEVRLPMTKKQPGEEEAEGHELEGTVG